MKQCTIRIYNVDFIDGNGRGSLLQGLNEYVNNSRYETSFGDLVPSITANALSVNLLIIENNGNQFEVQLIDCYIIRYMD